MTAPARRPARAVQPTAGRSNEGLTLRAAELQPTSWNPNTRTIDVIWSTGADVVRQDWNSGETYIERLSMDPAHVRLGRLNAGASVLDAHSAHELRCVIGAVVLGSARVEGGFGYATLRLSDDPDKAGIVADVAAGVIRHISVGYLVHFEVRKAGEAGSLPTRTATDWEAHELSFVPVPADAGAHSRAFGARSMNEAAKIMAACVALAGDTIPLAKVFKSVAKDSGLTPEAVGAIAKGEQEATPEELVAIAAALKLPVKLDDGESEAVEGAPAKPVEAPAAMAAAPVAGTQAADPVATERARTEAIMVLGRALSLPLADVQGHIASGKPLEEIRAMTINAAAAQSDTIRPRAQVQVLTDHSQQVREGIANAIEHRCLGATALTPAGRAFAGESILELGSRLLVEAGGVALHGTKAERARQLMTTRTMSTSDFPLLLANVQGKRLLEAYEEEGINFEPVGTKVSLPDLKEVSRVGMGQFPNLLPVAEGADYVYATVGESREVYRLAKLGILLKLTEECLINDDLNGFMQTVDAAGAAGAAAQKDIFWGVWTTNAHMADGNPLFSAAHGNLVTGPGTVFSPTNLGLARAAMRKQTGIGGVRNVSIRPTHIVAGVDSELLIDQTLNGIYYPTAGTGATTPVMRSLQVITDPRLDSSPDPWYLAAGKRGMEYGYLAGEEGMQLTEETEWRNDCIVYKAKMRFAAKAIDWRYLYCNVGA